MSGTFTVNLAKPVISVKILTAESAKDPEQELQSSSMTSADSAANLMQDLEKQKAETVQLYRALSSVVDELNRFYDGLLAGYKKEIAKLSVEIARKILMHKVHKGDYQIEAIVKEALRNAPVHQDIAVHLNPADLAQLRSSLVPHPSSLVPRETMEDGRWRMEDSAGVEFIADSNIGPAECLVETPKGIVKSLIDEHLAQIAEALEKAE